MPRRLKLDVEAEWPYHLLGITSSLSDYRLVHFLAKLTGLLFFRMDDLNVKLSSSQLRLPLFAARDKMLRVDYLLIPNGIDGSFLILAEKRFDYFLITGGEGEAPLGRLAKDLQKVQHIRFCHQIDISKWKEAPLFFHDLEMGSLHIR